MEGNLLREEESFRQWEGTPKLLGVKKQTLTRYAELEENRAFYTT